MSHLFPSLRGDSSPLLISGPCSAESREQLLRTALELQREVNLKLFRAGAWKPRTTPGGFEGYGRDALGWLRDVREKTGLLVGTEVGTPIHATLAKDYGMDFIWIGARTVSSPFAVEEIAASLEGYDKPVLVKNPLAPDIDLWIGALSRLKNHGVLRTGAILRGFTIGGESALRNMPLWHLVEEFRRKAGADIPLICDPSHIAGNRSFIPSVIRESLRRNLDGLLIESHCCPQEALTDRDQQVTPADLRQILEEVKMEDDLRATGDHTPPELARLRLRLDQIDEEVVRLLGERLRMTDQIGAWKSFHHLTPFQEEREKALYSSRGQLARIYGVPETLVDDLYHLVHSVALKRQEERSK